MSRIRVVHVGTGNRSVKGFLPIISKMTEELELAAICGRSPDKVKPLGAKYGTPVCTDVEEALEKYKPDMVTAIVNCSANYEVVEKIARHGVSCIIETPIEIDLKKGLGLIELTKKHGVKIEVAENSFRMPRERLAKKVLESGQLGRIMLAYNDLGTHGYHAMNRIRNYVGFGVEVKSVAALHHSMSPDGQERSFGFRMAHIEFANGVLGVHSIGYGLPANPWKLHKNFVCDKGWLACGEGVYLDGKRQKKFRIKREHHKVEGVDVCTRMVAEGLPQEIQWKNPFAAKPFNDEQVSMASVLVSMARAVRDGVEQEYSLADAYKDYEIDSAMCSSHVNGRRVNFPLDLDAIADERARKLY